MCVLVRAHMRARAHTHTHTHTHTLCSASCHPQSSLIVLTLIIIWEPDQCEIFLRGPDKMTREC